MEQPEEMEPIHALARIERTAPDSELEALYGTDQARLLMQAVPYFYRPDALPDGYLQSQQRFGVVLRDMRERYSTGSQALGRAMITAYALQKAGNVSGAIKIYRDFAQTCAMPFYADIARFQADKLQDRSTAGARCGAEAREKPKKP